MRCEDLLHLRVLAGVWLRCRCPGVVFAGFLDGRRDGLFSCSTLDSPETFSLSVAPRHPLELLLGRPIDRAEFRLGSLCLDVRGRRDFARECRYAGPLREDQVAPEGLFERGALAKLCGCGSLVCQERMAHGRAASRVDLEQRLVCFSCSLRPLGRRCCLLRVGALSFGHLERCWSIPLLVQLLNKLIRLRRG